MTEEAKIVLAEPIIAAVRHRCVPRPRLRPRTRRKKEESDFPFAVASATSTKGRSTCCWT